MNFSTKYVVTVGTSLFIAFVWIGVSYSQGTEPLNSENKPSLNLSELAGLFGLIGFAVQQFLGLIDPLVTRELVPFIKKMLKWKTPTAPPDTSGILPAMLPVPLEDPVKKWSMAVLGLSCGWLIVDKLGLSLLSSTLPCLIKEGEILDKVITAFLIGFGTAGSNEIVKYIGYLKTNAKAEYLTDSKGVAVTISPSMQMLTLKVGEQVSFLASVANTQIATATWRIIGTNEANATITSVGNAVSFSSNAVGRYSLVAISTQFPEKSAGVIIDVQ